MSSVSSTDQSGDSRDTGFHAWHIFLLISMCGATWAVIVSRHAHPAALLMMSAAVISAGLAGLALYKALSGFFSIDVTGGATSTRTREFLEKEKALLLRSLKELEFDRAMGKIGDADFAELSSRLRARAMELMEELDRPAPSQSSRSGATAAPRAARNAREAGRCASCSTTNDADARFCKQCGSPLS